MKFKKIAQAVVAVLLLLSSAAVVLPAKAEGDGSLSLTVVPPFFQLPLNPGESWSSSIKVVNPNSYDLTVYTQLMDFQAQGEEGHGKFVPVTDPNENSLAQWVTITQNPIVIARDGSTDVPFTVHIPKDAPPGGQYAAILIGTKPTGGAASGPTIQVASYISTLLFIRVAGNVTEKGDIREFYANKTFFQTPDAAFTLRFENSGNVHLQPQGDITIYNMWGKQRGKIEVNQNTEFGYVMPNSIRKFQFTWSGESNIFDIGRYKAIATLTYGLDSRQNVYSVTYFWIVPLKPVLGILAGLILFILLLSWSIKRYVKKALRSEAARLGIQSPSAGSRSEVKVAPVRYEQSVTRGQKRGLLALVLILLVVGIIGFIIYFTQVLKSERGYQMTLQGDDGTTQALPQQ